jgi:proteasome lid subunit RPN8/RPN11
MSSTPFRLLLPRQIHTQIVQQAQTEKPNECCGLLAGTTSDAFVKCVTIAYPLVNELARPTAYRSEPRSILAAYKDIDRRSLDVVGVYHSHPTAPPNPSGTDLANNYLGDTVVHVIISLTTASPVLRAWRLFETSYEEVFWELCD